MAAIAPGSALREVLSVSEFGPLLAHYITAQMAGGDDEVVPILKGPPGIGKTEQVRAVCRNQVAAWCREQGWPVPDTGVECRDFMRLSQMESIDVRGQQNLLDVKHDRVTWLKPEWLPDFGPPVVLFWDELGNPSSDSVFGAMMQVFHDRRAGIFKIPARVALVAATNREIDRSMVRRLPSALSRRFTHHELKADSANEWCALMFGPYGQARGIDPVVPAFIRFREALLHDFRPADAVDPNPRAWEKVSKLYRAKLPKLLLFSAVCGTVGRPAAEEFFTFESNWTQLPSLDAILMLPDKEPVPDRMDLKCAVATGLSLRATRQNYAAVLRYVHRMGHELETYAVMTSIARDSGLKSTPAFVEWATKNQGYLL